MAGRLYNTPFAALLPGSIATDPTIKAAAASLDGVLNALVLSVPNLLIYSRLLLTAGSLGGRTPSLRLLPALERIITARGGLKPLSTAELELLAWQFHVDFREVARTDRQLAEMILQSIPWHRIKGTPASIKRALGLFGYGVSSPSGTTAGRVAERAMSKTGTALPGVAMPAIASVAQDVRPSGIIIEEDGTGKYWATYQLGLPQIADTHTVQHIVKICNEMAPARCRLWRIYTDAFDRRPIILSHGPVLGSGWLSFYSGVSVPEAPGSDDDVIVSFGTRNAYQVEQAYPDALCASFGGVTHFGFLAPYLDRFVVGRSKLSDVYPRNHGFFMGSLFSILWADRATTGRRWRGEWDARRWLDYTGFDRKLPPWRMEKRAVSRAQLVPGWADPLGTINARLGATFATFIDAPMRLGESRLSLHDSQRRELRLHEMFVDMQGHETPPVHPGIPHAAGASLLVSSALVPSPHRVRQSRHDECAVLMIQREALPPREAASLALAAQSVAVTPDPAPPTAVTSFRAPLWLGAWSEPGRTWTTPRKISTQ